MNQESKFPTAFLFPRLRDIVFIIIFVGALALGPRMLNTDSDLGRDLVLGNYILNAHQIPTRDLLSFTKAGQPRPPYEWLAQVLFAAAYHLLNLDGVMILTAVILGITFAFIYSDSVHRSDMPLASLIVVLWAAVASSVHWLTRPHVFSFLFLAIWIYGLERIRLGQKFRLWFFPLLMLVWANTHGGFIFGFLAWGAYLAAWLIDVWRKRANVSVGINLLTAGSASFAASVLTPDLWHNWEAVFSNNSLYILSHTAETMPPDFALPAVWPFAGLLILTLILCLIQWRRMPASHAFLLAGLAAMSLLMARNIPLYAIAAAPILSRLAGKTIRPLSYWTKIEDAFTSIEASLRGFLWPAVFAAAAMGFFSFHAIKTGTTIYQFDPRVFPVQATDWIKANPMAGNMFNDSNWGGYLLYRLWPAQRVFVDSQSDFYGEAFMRQYSGIYNGESNWEAELTRYNVDWIIVPHQTGLAAAMLTNHSWQVVYQDPTAIIFKRK
jgi:hypothetical protein